ncbi:MAG: hypothetical protein K0Q92_652 [Steroidobacteraceae bacterium]|jgi:hypothetical protein|nr:hypothetical protein [Steroidobacteraceae bacterium]
MSNEASEYNELLDIVSDIVNAGHMDQEGLARLRAHLGYKPTALATQRQAEPVAYQYQDREGKWYPFMDERHYENTVAEGSWPIRALYTEPVASAADELTDAQRYRWLRARLVGIDFDWNENGFTALCFRMPNGIAGSADCDETIDAAMQKDTQ